MVWEVARSLRAYHRSRKKKSALNTLQTCIIRQHVSFTKRLCPRQLDMHIGNSRDLELDLLVGLQLQDVPTKRAIVTDEVQVLARHKEALPCLRAAKPNHRPLDILVLGHKLRLAQLTQRLAVVLLPLDGAAFIVAEHAGDAIRHEQILHVRIDALEHPVHGVFVLQGDVQRVLGLEARARRVGHLVRRRGLADGPMWLQLVDLVVEQEELAVHAHERPQAVVAFAEKGGDRDARVGDPGHQSVDERVLVDVVGFNLGHFGRMWVLRVGVPIRWLERSVLLYAK